MSKSSFFFPEMTFHDWEKKVYDELGERGAPYRVWEGNSIEKYFTSALAKSTIRQYDNHLGSANTTPDEIRSWNKVTVIDDKDVSKANGHALNALMTGADGIHFKHTSSLAVDQLLNDVLPEYISLCFTESSIDSADQLRSWIGNRNIDPLKWHGYMSLDAPNIEDYTHLFKLWEPYPNFRFIHFNLTLAEPSGWTTQLVDFINDLIARFDALTNEGFSPSDLWNRMVVSVAVGTEFFEEIARLRAIRILAYKIARAFEVTGAVPEELFIHAHSPAWVNEGYQPHGNMIKGCTAGLASLLGGATSISIHPEDPNSALDARIAQNMSLILKEECHLHKVKDPVAGSYYIENLTDSLARNAWKTVVDSFRK